MRGDHLRHIRRHAEDGGNHASAQGWTRRARVRMGGHIRLDAAARVYPSTRAVQTDRISIRISAVLLRADDADEWCDARAKRERERRAGADADGEHESDRGVYRAVLLQRRRGERAERDGERGERGGERHVDAGGETFG